MVECRNSEDEMQMDDETNAQGPAISIFGLDEGVCKGGIRVVAMSVEDADDDSEEEKKESTANKYLAAIRPNQQYSIQVESLPTISMENVKTHKSIENCWTVVDGLVYDVTSYIPYHPGGKKKIMLGAGKDSSKMFHRFHKGVDLPTTKLSKLCIGRVCGQSEVQTYEPP